MSGCESSSSTFRSRVLKTGQTADQGQINVLLTGPGVALNSRGQAAITVGRAAVAGARVPASCGSAIGASACAPRATSAGAARGRALRTRIRPPGMRVAHQAAGLTPPS